jgi:hypothetical protein
MLVALFISASVKLGHNRLQCDAMAFDKYGFLLAFSISSVNHLMFDSNAESCLFILILLSKVFSVVCFSSPS